MNIDEVINGWTFDETIKTAESLMETEKNMLKWDVIRHLRDFAEKYREQLKEYQQLEEKGRLIKLPCKVGDTLYKIIVDKYTKCSLHDKEFSLNCEYCEEKCDSKAIYVIKDFTVFDINEIIFYMKSIGKTVFLTRDEAEAKLKELRGGENE